MRGPKPVALLLALAVGGSGCVYYNGMYNARRLAGSAWKAERDGRPYQAASLWGQVAVKAESVAVRHPTSRWADEATVLRGIALARLKQCDAAMELLDRTPRSGPHSQVAEEAALALGRCQLKSGHPEAADLAFGQVLGSRDPARRQEAQLGHAKVLRLSGRHEAALAALARNDAPEAREERLLVLAGSGRRRAALAEAHSLVRAADSTRSWDSLLVALGEADPAVASRFLDLVLRSPRSPARVRARWLLEDGIRLARTDPPRARARLRQAASHGRAGGAVGEAELELLRMDLARIRTPGELGALSRRVARFAGQGVAANGEAAPLAVPVAMVLAADSVAPLTPQGELRLFLAAEAARDLLGAPALAAGLFRRAAEGWPDSPYAPKAILAAARLDSVWADTAQALLLERYAASPYVAALRGEEAPEFATLEDSLRTFASTAAAAPAAGRRLTGPRRRPGAALVEDDDPPLRRSAQPGRPRPGTRLPDPK